jgi:hypothetical protein
MLCPVFLPVRVVREKENWQMAKNEKLTTTISFPAALRNAFVHRTLRGFRFILENKSKEVERVSIKKRSIHGPKKKRKGGSDSLEILMTFGSTELENFSIVTDKLHACCSQEKTL